MQEKIIIESKRPFNFEPYCVRCNKKTKSRFFFNMPPFMIIMLGPVLAFLFYNILKMDTHRPWVPYCQKCQWLHALPNKKSIFLVIFTFATIGLSVFLLINAWFIAGLLIFACSLIAIFIIALEKRKFRKITMPFSVSTKKSKIVYVFTSGAFYEKQLQQLNQDEASSNTT